MLLSDRGDDVALNLTDCPRESDHPDAPRPLTSAGRCARVDGRTRRVDVVDDTDLRRNATARDHAPANVPTALLQRQSALTWKRAAPLEHVDDRQRPDPAELDRERTRRDVAPAPRPLRVARHRNEGVDDGSRYDLRDDRRGSARQPSSPSLFPGANEPPRLRVVDDCRSGIPEGEPPPGAFATSSDRPRARGSAALADRR